MQTLELEINQSNISTARYQGYTILNQFANEIQTQVNRIRILCGQK